MVGEKSCILIAFPEHYCVILGYYTKNSTNGNFLKVICNMKPETIYAVASKSMDLIWHFEWIVYKCILL